MRRFILVLAIFFFLVSLLSLVVYLLNQPVDSRDSQPRSFIVNQGDSLSLIAQRLETAKLINHRYFFIALARILNLNQKLQAGKFDLSPSSTTRQIIFLLSEPGLTDYWFRITPGTRIEEFSPDQNFLEASLGSEGYLYPDSYLIPESYSPIDIIKLIQDHFTLKFNQAKENTTTTLSDPEVVTLASIVEREARTLPVKQTIAGILLNRLDINMALQTDATVQYARDSAKKPREYWQPLVKNDLKINSLFNTYLNPGLPPSPICNPGYDSLFAVFHPTPSDYLYYITDTNGVMHYATTLDEHNLNVAKYLK